jgi:flagellar M-ring protein FliF
MWDQIKRLAGSLNRRQQITIVLAAILLGVGLWAFTSWNRERNFRPLYSSLSAEDAGAVVQRLREEGVEYRLDEPGTIKVPADRVAEVRLRLAAAGVPKSGRIGFEIFDQTNFGLTEFAEKVNYRRAIEGELERSVASLSEVESARVHITLPRESVFVDAQREAKASVMVKLKPGQRLSPANAAAICHLVSSAVEHLAPEAVTLIDSNGNLLARPPKRSAEGDDPPEASLEYRRSLEKDLAQKVQATLEPLLGAENFRAGVSVECDFAGGEQSEETYDPARSVMVTSARTEDVSGISQPGGAPGTASNLPRPQARRTNAASGVTRRTENITYQSSRLVRRLRIPQGTVRRVSVAVLVNQKVRFEGAGGAAKRIFEPPPPETLKTIRTLVAGVLGLSEQRGDQLTVESLPFESLLLVEPPPGPAAPPPGFSWPAWVPAFLRQFPPAVVAGVAVALLFVVAAAAFLWLRRKRRTAPSVSTPPAVGPGGEDHQLPSGPSLQEQLEARESERKRLEEEALAALRLPPPDTKKSEVLVKHLREVAKKDPAGMAQLVRSWLNETER